MLPDPGIPKLSRRNVSFGLLVVVWAVITLCVRATIDSMELTGLWRYLLLGSSLLVYWYTARRVLGWGGASRG